MKWVGYNQMMKDRARRDAIRSRFDTDVDHIKAELSFSNLGKRAAIRAKEGAAQIYEETSDFVSQHKTLVSIVAGVGTLWLLRKPISGLFSDDEEPSDDHEHNEVSARQYDVSEYDS